MSKIKRVCTRYPNLECGAFKAMLDDSRRTKENLGLTSGEIEFVFQSTNHEGPRDPDAVYFNTGGRDWDQHGHPDNRSLAEMCSLDLVRGDYDFLKRRPWLPEAYELVRQNDIRGTRVSNHPRNLRELMNGLTWRYPNDPKLVLDWLALAFCGVFENRRNGMNIKKVFDPQCMSAGVAAYDASRSEWFEQLLAEAIKSVNLQESWAKNSIAKAEELKRTAEIMVPSIGVKVKVIEVLCDSIKTAPMARSRGYQFVIQWHRDSGQVQIHGGFIKKGDAKLQLDLAPLAKRLRQVEAAAEGMLIDPADDLSAPLMIRFVDGRRIPWFFPEYRTSVYNGTLSSADVAPTKIDRYKLFNIVMQILPQCQPLAGKQDGDSAGDPAETPAS